MLAPPERRARKPVKAHKEIKERLERPERWDRPAPTVLWCIGLFLVGTNTHGNEMYGTMSVYLRLKGLVPPTTERQNAAKKSQ